MVKDKTLRGISLFSGAGGDTLGMINANIDVVGFVENDKDAIETHKINFPECNLIGTDITKIQNKIFQQYKNIDILFGGFPCQSFSNGGKKNPNDKRGELYKEFVRIANIIKPKVVLGENVKGLLTRKDDDDNLILDKIMNSFNDIGYNMKCITINCENFGVPQKRTRILIIGINKNINVDINKLDFPNTNNKIKVIRDILTFDLENALKVEKDIPIDTFFENLENEDSEYGKPETNLLKCYNNDELSFRVRKKPTFSCIEDIDKPSHTILCTYNRMPRLFVPLKNKNGIFLRTFKIFELKQLQGFPINFSFYGNKISQIKQIGNAIPPIIVSEILNYLKFKNII